MCTSAGREISIDSISIHETCIDAIRDFISKITIIVIFVFDLLTRALFFLLLVVVFFGLLLAHLLLTLSSGRWLLLAGVAACEDAFFGFLLDLVVEFLVAAEGLDLISFLLLSDLLEFLLGLLQLLLFNFVESLELVLQIVQVSVLVDVCFLERGQFLL